MNCIGLIIWMHCFQAQPVVVSEFCKVARPLVTLEEYRPSRRDSEGSRLRYAALKKRYRELCSSTQPDEKVRRHGRS